MKLRVRVPATTSNLGPGFDCFGMALSLFLEVHLEPAATLMVTADRDDIPRSRDNLIVRTFLDALPPGTEEPRVLIHIENRIPLARGLGSSAAARVAGLALAEAWAGQRTKVDGAAIALRSAELEGHPDNATPAVHGGFCVCAGTRFERIEMDRRPYLLLIPALEIHTEAARAALPRQRSLEDAVFNLQRAAWAAARVAQHHQLGAMVPFEDRLHQRYRLALDARLERAFAAVVKLPSVEAAFLSGSGPTVFVLPTDLDAATHACEEAFRAAGLEMEAHMVTADNAGLQVSA